MALNTEIEEKSEEIHVERVAPMLFRKEMRAALEAGAKKFTRRIVTPANSTTSPGSFGDIQWDTGRVKRLDDGRIVLRAQCDFEGGPVRVVTVSPKTQPSDLIWVRESRYMSRRKSRLTLDVLSVGLSRIRDMTDQQAIEEGIEYLPPRMRKHCTPREAFAALWDDIHGADAWNRNDWVWVIGVTTHAINVDEWLNQRSAANGQASADGNAGLQPNAG